MHESKKTLLFLLFLLLVYKVIIFFVFFVFFVALFDNSKFFTSQFNYYTNEEFLKYFERSLWEKFCQFFCYRWRSKFVCDRHCWKMQLCLFIFFDHIKIYIIIITYKSKKFFKILWIFSTRSSHCKILLYNRFFHHRSQFAHWTLLLIFEELLLFFAIVLFVIQTQWSWIFRNWQTKNQKKKMMMNSMSWI